MAISRHQYHYYLCLLLLALAFINLATTSIADRSPTLDTFDRTSFPKDFVFGAAASSYQYEGAAFQDGRAPSIWDTFTHEHPEKIEDHSTGDVAVDFYHRYKEDIRLIKDVGLDAFRFSFSWSRILPKGKVSGGVNPLGVKFYSNLIDELILNGLQPYVTLFHWDSPQALDDEYGGFLSPKIEDDFIHYANFCFATFGDRVRHWVTFNEPYEYSVKGYGTGVYAPGRCSSYTGNCTAGNSATEPYIVAHHELLSHASAVKLYREKYKVSQGGEIGITLSSSWFVPFSKNAASQKATQRAMDFWLGWFLHPLTYGDYPKIMQTLVKDRLPVFTKSESQMLKKSFDFLGINYYTSHYAADAVYVSNVNLSVTSDSRVVTSSSKNGVYIGQPTTSSTIFICPKGIEALMLYIKDFYGSPTIVITENGCPEKNNCTLAVEECLDDELRITYHFEHLIYLLKAIKEGVDLKGYFMWSFLDNFEWADGYTVRYGMTYVDYRNGLRRYPKKSSTWFHNFLKRKDLLYRPSTLQKESY